MTKTTTVSKPMIFTGESVRAILDGRKTQTRRVIPHNARGADQVIWIPKERGRLWPGRDDEPYEGWAAQVGKLNGLHLPLTCPHPIGSQVWVREAWLWNGGAYCYKADSKMKTSWCSPIMMPRWASRLTLEITDVRVQRVQEIDIADCHAEGIEPTFNTRMEDDIFADVWDSINGKKHPWSSNPWVWAYTFRKVEP